MTFRQWNGRVNAAFMYPVILIYPGSCLYVFRMRQRCAYRMNAAFIACRVSGMYPVIHTVCIRDTYRMNAAFIAPSNGRRPTPPHGLSLGQPLSRGGGLSQPAVEAGSTAAAAPSSRGGNAASQQQWGTAASQQWGRHPRTWIEPSPVTQVTGACGHVTTGTRSGYLARERVILPGRSVGDQWVILPVSEVPRHCLVVSLTTRDRGHGIHIPPVSEVTYRINTLVNLINWLGKPQVLHTADPYSPTASSSLALLRCWARKATRICRPCVSPGVRRPAHARGHEGAWHACMTVT